MHLDALDINVEALALDDCPNAVSLGRLVIEHGYTFRWDPNGKLTGFVKDVSETRLKKAVMHS